MEHGTELAAHIVYARNLWHQLHRPRENTPSVDDSELCEAGSHVPSVLLDID